MDLSQLFCNLRFVISVPFRLVHLIALITIGLLERNATPKSSSQAVELCNVIVYVTGKHTIPHEQNLSSGIVGIHSPPLIATYGTLRHLEPDDVYFPLNRSESELTGPILRGHHEVSPRIAQCTPRNPATDLGVDGSRGTASLADCVPQRPFCNRRRRK